jgi:UDP-N-acetylglucosamine 3-dehydrogenase
MRRLKTVLIGAGKMGRNHLRVLLESSNFEVVAVVDPRVHQLFAQPAFAIATSLSTLPAMEWDCAIVAVPTAQHFEVASSVIERGKPLLLEKPLAATPAECEQLIALSEARGVRVAVGHLERFNPAILKVRELVCAGWLGRAVHFSFTRVGGYPEGQSGSNNVLLDLAVHDLDVLRFLIGPVRVNASVCHSAWRAGVLDTAEILLTGESGQSASIHTNWVTPTKLRTLRVTGTRGVCIADYMLQSCTMFGGNVLKRAAATEFDFESLLEEYKSTDRVEFGIAKQEPLKVQLEMFYKLLNGEPSEICLPRDAAAAVSLATEAMRIAVHSVHLGADMPRDSQRPSEV